jgi:hypothetical protein
MTLAMVARVTTALDERIGRALAVAAYLLSRPRHKTGRWLKLLVLGRMTIATGLLSERATSTPGTDADADGWLDREDRRHLSPHRESIYRSRRNIGSIRHPDALVLE